MDKRVSRPFRLYDNVKEGFSGDYGVKLAPQKLCTFCEIDWPSFDMVWLSEVSLDKAVIARVYQVIVGNPSHPVQFPYMDSLHAVGLTQPPLLRACLEENCRVNVGLGHCNLQMLT